MLDTRSPPVPRRRRWVRRLLAAVLTLTLASAGVWGWAVWRLAREADEADAAAAEADRLDPGWRLEELEAKRDDPPAAENGALKLLAVKAMFPTKQLPGQFFGLFNGLPPEARLSEAQVAALRDVLDGRGPAVAEARTLVNYPRGRYPVQWAPYPTDTLLDSLDAREVAGWLAYDAWLRAEAGDLATALADGRAIFQASRAIGDEPTALSQLTRIGVRAIGVGLLERLLAQGEPPADGLAELQRWLAAEELVPLLLIMARGERAMYERLVTTFFGTMPRYERLYLSFSPTMNPMKSRSVGLRYFNEYVEVAKLPEHLRPGRLPTLEDDPKKVTIMAGLLAPSFDRAGRACARSHAQLRCAIAALAAERFRRGRGRWPDSLAELVTAGLLTAVPTDPFDFRPVRYRRLDDGMAIYTIGPDGTDDGGALNRQMPPDEPGTDIGLRLWDVTARRQPPRPPAPANPSGADRS